MFVLEFLRVKFKNVNHLSMVLATVLFTWNYLGFKKKEKKKGRLFVKQFVSYISKCWWTNKLRVVSSPQVSFILFKRIIFTLFLLVVLFTNLNISVILIMLGGGEPAYANQPALSICLSARWVASFNSCNKIVVRYCHWPALHLKIQLFLANIEITRFRFCTGYNLGI